jgi:pantoate--beta-alanine ligase
MSFPIEIVPAPTLRESDGLAMSSRNQYLQGGERDTAVEIHRTLRDMQERAKRGEAIAAIEAAAKAKLEAAGFVLDYAEVRRADLTRPRDAGEAGLLALIAARLGRTRLIDNLPFDEE